MFGLENLIKSAVRGGAVKGLIRAGVPKLVKGLKRSGIQLIRGIKGTSAQARALPRAVSEAFKDVRYGSMHFPMTTREMLKEFTEQVSYDLAAASKTALKQDAAQRIAARLAKVLGNKQQSKALENILKNARANETLGGYAARNLGKVPKFFKSLIREGAENVAIDQTGQAILKGLGAVATAATAGGVGALVANKTK